MPLTVKCPHCQQKVKVDENLAGKKFSCPACKKNVSVPAPAGVAAGSPLGAPPADDLALLPSGQLAEALGEKSFKRCPGCGHDLPVPTVLCTSCGHNFSTGKSVRGHVINQPGRAKYYLGTVLRTVFFLGLFGLGIRLVIYAIYEDNLGEALSNIGKNEAAKTDGAGSSGGAAAPAVGATPVASTKSLLVIINRRFPLVNIFANEPRIGQVQVDQTEKIVIPSPTVQGKPLKISFEVQNLPPGMKLAPEMLKFLNEGLNFTGSATEGMQVVLKGPPAGMLPKADEVIRGLQLDPTLYDSASGTGRVKEFSYKGIVCKAPAPGGFLRLACESKGARVDLKWIEQDCSIEKDGKEIYNSRASPFESKPIKIVASGDKVDVAP